MLLYRWFVACSLIVLISLGPCFGQSASETPKSLFYKTLGITPPPSLPDASGTVTASGSTTASGTTTASGSTQDINALLAQISKPAKRRTLAALSFTPIRVDGNWREIGGSGGLTRIKQAPDGDIISIESSGIAATTDCSYTWNGSEFEWQAYNILKYRITFTTQSPYWLDGGQLVTFSDSNNGNFMYWDDNGAIGYVGLQREISIKSVETIPGTLYIDRDGAGSGIVFRAVADSATPITFQVKSSSGEIKNLGAVDAVANGSDFTAKLNWWGPLPEGTYTLIAQAGISSKERTFEVKHIKASCLGMGTWLNNTKDPSNAVPPEPKPQSCPLQTWDTATGNNVGYFQSLSVGDPVNIVSGNYTLAQIDLTLKARNSLTLARIYNSLDSNIGPFGRGWSSPYLSHLDIRDTSVAFFNSDGSRILYQKQGSAYVGPSDIDLSLSVSTDTGFWALRRPDGMEWTFDATGKIIRMTNSCCGKGALDSINFEYNASGTVHRVVNPANQWFEFDYDSNGRATKVTDFSGRSVLYSYDQAGNLGSFTDPIGRITVYSYNEDGFLTQVKEPGNRVTSVTYSDLRATSVTTPDGSSSSFDWDLTNQKLVLTDVVGTKHEYSFSSDWVLKSYAVPSANINKTFTTSGTAIIGFENSQAAKSSFTFNSAGLLDSITNASGNTSYYEYHPTFHKLTKKTDPLGRTWLYTWCPRGNLISETDPSGGITSYTYDAFNNRTSKTDQLGRVTKYEFSADGNYLLKVTDPLGGVSSFSYDVRGNLTSASDALKRVTTFEYDPLNRLKKTVYPDGRWTAIEYDDADNIVKRIDNLNRVTSYSYDPAGRMVAMIRPDGSVLNYEYNASGKKISETGPFKL
ncbi:MAG: RHS repeat protein [Candidatus Riflebacteria bacterium]|nr:RHS repeat protein [Candidatus Riflebacteria bacterium]